MASFTDVSEVEAVLQSLLERESGPLVAKLAREPGRRESRYMQLFGGEPPPQALATEALPDEVATHTAGVETLVTRVARLEDEVRQLRAELEELKSRNGD
jgi:hypothetical protein